MQKRNNKGFILVETLIVTVFVVTLFIFVYRATLPSIGEYEQQNYYDDIDSVYYSNLFKQMITRYANIDYIDDYLTENTYMDISDCTNSNIYSNNNYCQLLKNKLSIRDDDKILLTKYNIKDFKQEVKTNDYFDSGTLSNFRDYIKTVSNHEPFYSNLNQIAQNKKNGNFGFNFSSNLLASVANKVSKKYLAVAPQPTNTYIGKYRLFIIRTVVDADGSTSRRYSNIGVYTGTNPKFLMGEKVIFDPGDGEKEFYVLHNSRSTDPKVTLILAQNLPSSNGCFNETKTSTIPTTVLDNLKKLTNGWSNVPYLQTQQETSQYTINYMGYRARLLVEDDILSLLGCKEDQKTCFDSSLAFEVPFNEEKHQFLIDNLTETSGYWTGMVVPNSDYYAWGVMKGKITPTDLNDCINMGIRPVIEVEKKDVRRDE